MPGPSELTGQACQQRRLVGIPRRTQAAIRWVRVHLGGRDGSDLNLTRASLAYRL